MNLKNKNISFYKETTDNFRFKDCVRVNLYAVVESKNKIIKKYIKPKIYKQDTLINKISGKIDKNFSAGWCFDSPYFRWAGEDINLFLNDMFNGNNLYFGIIDWDERNLSPEERSIKGVLL